MVYILVRTDQIDEFFPNFGMCVSNEVSNQKNLEKLLPVLWGGSMIFKVLDRSKEVLQVKVTDPR